jgi:hypothetical protein
VNRSGPQRSSKTELVTVGIGQVEKALAPFRIAGRGVGSETGSDETGVQSVDIRYVEYQAPPPGPLALGGLGDQIDEIVASTKAAEFRVLTPVEKLKPEHAVKPDSTPHVVCGQRDGADAFDHMDPGCSDKRPQIMKPSNLIPVCAALRSR